MAVPYGYDNEGEELTGITYADDNNYYDEWNLYAPSPCGSRAYNYLNSSEKPELNCLWYAMDLPVSMKTNENFNCVSESTANSYLSDLSATSNDILYGIQSEFTSWLDNVGELTENIDWNQITSTSSTNEKYYRVVMRVGSMNAYMYGVLVNYWDYHYWYQTLDGRWANKHGTGGDPELLPVGISPPSASTTGWDLDLTEGGGPYLTGFYNSDILYFVISTER